MKVLENIFPVAGLIFTLHSRSQVAINADGMDADGDPRVEVEETATEDQNKKQKRSGK